jgi:hypothetical protein
MHSVIHATLTSPFCLACTQIKHKKKITINLEYFENYIISPSLLAERGACLAGKAGGE